jgi:hypothetical protein
MGENKNAYKVLVGKPARKRQIGRPRLSWEDNIKMDFKGIRREEVDQINMTHDRDKYWLL